jgi:hypothetical protein
LTESIPLSGNHEGSFELEFRPLSLTPQPIEANLTLRTKELGDYYFKLILKSLPTPLRQALRFEVPLGETRHFG